MLQEQQLTKRINFLLGKNGSGKSIALRTLEQNLSGDNNWFVKYITPERGGTLLYEPNVDRNIQGNLTWLRDTRRKNRFEQFREQTVAQFRNLELSVLREIETDEEVRKSSATFQSVIDQINSLLPLIRLVRLGTGFEIERIDDNSKIGPEAISSGEAEAIALAIEALVFSRESRARDNKLLLIDEPDVHLHPDLQARFIRFLANLAREKDFKVLIATHSTALVGSLENTDDVQVAFMPLTTGAQITFSPVNEIAKAVLPIFGAHPLSNIFNEKPILLVEGDDDKRIWDQVVRSSKRGVSLFPCPAGSVDKIAEWETWLIEKLPSLYDNPKAFSLRDRDDAMAQLDDRPPIIRCRFACRAAENLILADDTLDMAGTKWETIINRCDKWLESNTDHPHHAKMKEFVDSKFDRFDTDLKEIRNILVSFVGVARPWEVLVGQAVAAMDKDGSRGKHSLRAYLGEKVCAKLLGV
jgi:energy-coupling factor transporter ATP-binding protein EcfA2